MVHLFYGNCGGAEGAKIRSGRRTLGGQRQVLGGGLGGKGKRVSEWRVDKSAQVPPIPVNCSSSGPSWAPSRSECDHRDAGDCLEVANISGCYPVAKVQRRNADQQIGEK
jgi:hypothetical protein